MAAVNVHVAEVEARLSALRRRRNSLLAQQALAYVSTTLLLTGAAIVALALRGSPRLFAAVTAIALASASAALAYLAWWTWSAWQSLSDVARHADADAALDDRLTTLLAVPASAPSPLLPLLVEQLLTTRQRWSVDALAPQRLARPLALIPLALAVFAAAAFYARPPATSRALPASARLAASPTQLDEEADGALFAAETRGDTGTGRGSESRAMAAADASGAARPADTSRAAGTLADQLAGGVAPAPGALAGLQQSIRGALGAPAAAGTGAQGDRPPATGADNASASAGSPARRAADAGSEPRADGSRAPAAAANANRGAAPAARTGGDGGGAAKGSGGGGGRGDGAIYGSAAGEPGSGGASAAPMAIKLTAISAISPAQSEPQRRAGGLPAAPTNATRASTAPPAMAAEQLADATIQRSDLSPEHEGIVRRIFTRQ